MRKTLTALLTACSLALGANLALAADRDIGPDEAMKLVQAGTIQPFDKLNEAAVSQYPGSQIEETELEEQNGRYLYKVELRDTQRQKWDVTLDAATGELLENKMDD